MKITDEMVRAALSAEHLNHRLGELLDCSDEFAKHLVRAALSAALAAQEALNIPDNWLPTSENINALPRPLRDYIMRLHANTDPAGELQRAMIAEMERDALRKMLEWRPIETAPRGVHVIVYNGYWVGQSYWGKVSHVPIYGWLDIFQGPENAELMEDPPTHWMPLPEAPDVGG